ncbi:helix-turn-helix domain-containing protein [Streptomyces sp. NPDC002896]|uniref:TetR/AcrR family transcriptional regulator n=1 Tax=Streptomyces sp. NPDC002896 TaxID=3154438 RepID=UPI00332A9A59
MHTLPAQTHPEDGGRGALRGPRRQEPRGAARGPPATSRPAAPFPLRAGQRCLAPLGERYRLAVAAGAAAARPLRLQDLVRDAFGDRGASMEQIAEAAGVAPTTVHRRFASRRALIEALAESAVARPAQAVEDSRPDTTPPLVALHRITANVLRVKSAWSSALGRPAEEGGAASAD